MTVFCRWRQHGLSSAVVLRLPPPGVLRDRAVAAFVPRPYYRAAMIAQVKSSAPLPQIPPSGAGGEDEPAHDSPAEIPAGVCAWLVDIHRAGADLRAGRVDPAQWQRRLTDLMGRADIPGLLAAMSFPQLTQGIDWPGRGEASLRPQFPAVAGLPAQRSFIARVFALKRGRSVPPHGHDNMASAFIVLAGSVRARLYDRLASAPDSMVIRHSFDRACSAGDYWSMTQHADNVHWFEATSETAFLLDINVMGLSPEPSHRLFVDPAGEEMPGGAVRARRLSRDEAYLRYG